MLIGDGGPPGTILQWLHDEAPECESGGWTAPRWIAPGDVMLFYHTKRVIPRIVRFSEILEHMRGHRDRAAARFARGAIPVLLREYQIARETSGTIFACARVLGAAEVDRSAEERKRMKHWRSPVYAKIGNVHVFDHPLPHAEFGRAVTLSSGAITPLYGGAFDAVRDLLSARNRLPPYFRDARPTSVGFRDVTAATWRAVACGADARFLDEGQVRAFLIDYVLAELKDPRTRVHEECRCHVERDGRRGRSGAVPVADYFVRVACR